MLNNPKPSAHHSTHKRERNISQALVKYTPKPMNPHSRDSRMANLSQAYRSGSAKYYALLAQAELEIEKSEQMINDGIRGKKKAQEESNRLRALLGPHGRGIGRRMHVY